MIRTVQIIVTVLSAIFLWLSGITGVIGAIWLLFIGQWKLVLGSILAFAVIPMIVGFILGIPTLIFSTLMIIVSKFKLYPIAYVLMFIISSITVIILSLWGVGVYQLIMHAPAAEIKHPIPFIAYGYSLVTAPLGIMAAHEEGEAYGTWVGMLAAQGAYIIAVISTYASNSSTESYLSAIGIFIVAVIFLHLVVAIPGVKVQLESDELMM